MPQDNSFRRSGRPPSADATNRDLPRQPKPIIGREQDLALARRQLARVDVRLLTLTGPPGVGKTRVALELAAQISDDFDAGVAFVDLASINDARLVCDAIAHALGILDFGRGAPTDMVEEFLRDRSLLLVLDNFEQVLDAAEMVGRLLANLPRLKVVATSRAPLHLRWECEQSIQPLQLPDLDSRPAADAVAAAPAGQLFMERARAVSPSFDLSGADAAAVAEICMHLDGLPLAIELAAARIKLLPPRALLRRLLSAEHTENSDESPLRILAGQARDLPLRQQTLLRAINWSYDLLDQDEQVLFRRLSVFVGGCTIEAAEVIGGFATGEGLEVIASLVDKSLVWREEQADGEPRLRMLTTIREYAREQLAASGEINTIRARRSAYFLDLAERAAHQRVGPHQQGWFDRLEHERDNLRAVERWAAAQGDADTIMRLGAALWPFWLARGDASHARDRLAAMRTVVGQVTVAPALAEALMGAGLLAEKLGDYATCRSLLEQAVTVARELDDPRTLAAALDSLGRQEFIEGRYAESRALLEESHASLRKLDDRVGLARVLSHLGFLEYLEGRPAVARAIFEQGLALARDVEDQHRVAEFMDNLGNTFLVEGDYDNAAHMFQEAVDIWQELGQGHWLAMALNNLGKVQTLRGELALARRHLRDALLLSRRMGNRRRLAFIVAALSSLAAAEGDTERAAQLGAVAAAAFAEIGAKPGPPRYTPPGAFTPTVPYSTLDQAVEDSLVWLAEQPRPPQVGLTRRENEVVALLARGLTNRQIAEALVVTEGTAENYVQRVLSKLGFSNRAQIAVWAVERGIRQEA